MASWTTAVMMCALVLGTSPSRAAVYVIRPDGSGDYPTIQSAIDATVDGDVIELTDGTFSGDGNRDMDYGGRAITIRSQGGGAESCVINCGGYPGHDHRGFDFHSGEGPGSVLQAVTISHGRIDYGGGIRCEGSSPRLIGCIFADNAGYVYGGGLGCRSGSAPSVESCTFVRDSTEYGGGGVSCYQASPSFSHCTFADNMSGWGGAGLDCEEGSPTVTECSFTGNWTVLHYAEGGGLYCSHASASITNCRFIGNECDDHGAGASICDDSDATLTGCWFEGNTCAGRGGAICVWGGASLTLRDCTLWGNVAQVGGGGLYEGSAQATLVGCTIVGNSAPIGSGIMTESAGQVTADRAIVAFGATGEAVRCEGTTTATLSCCDLFGNDGGDWVGTIGGQYGSNGNISADPLFCNAGSGDFTLHANSPCAPDSNPDCGLIGAWPVNCGSTFAERTSWGAIKAMFRR
jgi:predicted outer membrane repeat protein